MTPKFFLAILAMLFTLALPAQERPYLDSLHKSMLELVHTDPQKGLSLAAELLEIHTRNDSMPGMALSLFNLGMAQAMTGDHELAIANSYKALRIVRDLNDTTNQIAINNTLAIAYYRIGKLDSSIYYHTENLHLARISKDSFHVHRSLNGLGTVYMKRNKHREALSNFWQAMELLGSNATVKELSSLYTNIGLTYKCMEKYDSASIYLNKSLDQYPSNFNAVANLASVERNLKNYDKALSLYNTVLDYFLKNKNLYNLTAVHCNIAELHTLKKEHHKALPHLQKAEEYGLASGSGSFLINVYSLLNETYAYLHQPDKSREYLDKYRDLVDSLDNIAINNQIEELEAKYESRIKDTEITQLEQVKELQTAQLTQEKNLRWLLVGSLVLIGAIAIIVTYFSVRMRKLNMELAMANETKNKFFAIVAHDLKGSVTAFQGMGDIIQNHLQRGRPERVVALGQKIEENSNQLQNLLDNLLRWSFTQLNTVPYSPERLNISEIVETVRNEVKPRADAKGISLSIKAEEGVYAYADKNAVMFVLRNLLNNAIKFSNMKGSIEVVAKTNNGQVELDVTDTGIGMTADEQQQVFDMSKKISRKGTSGEMGNGLGLVLCREFVSLNKGSLQISSEPGKGTSVAFKLPKAA